MPYEHDSDTGVSHPQQSKGGSEEPTDKAESPGVRPHPTMVSAFKSTALLFCQSSGCRLACLAAKVLNQDNLVPNQH